MCQHLKNEMYAPGYRSYTLVLEIQSRAISQNLDLARLREIESRVPTYKVDSWARASHYLDADTALNRPRPMSQSKMAIDAAPKPCEKAPCDPQNLV